jgi:L-rhamnose mutarotase
MIRRAFTMKLKPGALPEYQRHHDDVWPEMVREIERSGIARMTICHGDGNLFLFSEITDEKAWDRLWDSEISKKWSKVMSPLMEQTPDGKVAAGELTEVFHLATKARKKKTAHEGTRRRTKKIKRKKDRK